MTSSPPPSPPSPPPPEPTPDDRSPRPRSLWARWVAKFADAGDGLRRGWREESSVRVHVAVALATILLASLLGLDRWHWALLTLCIASVIAAECFNSAIERLVRVVSTEHRPELAATLHLAAGGVLALSIGAVIVGLITLLPPLLDWLLSQQAALAG